MQTELAKTVTYATTILLGVVSCLHQMIQMVHSMLQLQDFLQPLKKYVFQTPRRIMWTHSQKKSTSFDSTRRREHSASGSLCDTGIRKSQNSQCIYSTDLISSPAKGNFRMELSAWSSESRFIFFGDSALLLSAIGWNSDSTSDWWTMYAAKDSFITNVGKLNSLFVSIVFGGVWLPSSLFQMFKVQTKPFLFYKTNFKSLTHFPQRNISGPGLRRTRAAWKGPVLVNCY